jgi:putative ABC transport system substrate-binding protein
VKKAMTSQLLNRLSGFWFDNLKSKIKNLKWVGIFATAFTCVFGAAVVQAQQPTKLPRIGILVGSSPTANAARIEAFRQGLRELGYAEGRNVSIELRSAEGKFDRLPGLAAELVRIKVDVIVTTGPIVNRPAKDATLTIPIVMGFDNDPVANGFAASLARPGGNMTGLSNLGPEIGGKQLELLKAVLPKISRVAVLGNTKEPANSQSFKEAELAAGALRIRIQHVDVPSAKDIDNAFRTATKGRNEAILSLPNFILNPHRTRIAELAVRSRLPTIFNATEWVEAGGLMSYGTSITDLFRRAATYVDKILKGAKPADLPVEQPTKFEFVINLKAAKQIGLTIPPNVLARADRVIR